MKTVTISVASREEINARIMTAIQTGKYQGSHISFPSTELMFRVLGGTRWKIIETMTGAGPMGIRELARRLDRDVKSVHRDVHALLKAGVLWHADDGKIEFPFDAIEGKFTLRAA